MRRNKGGGSCECVNRMNGYTQEGTTVLLIGYRRTVLVTTVVFDTYQLKFTCFLLPF